MLHVRYLFLSEGTHMGQSDTGTDSLVTELFYEGFFTTRGVVTLASESVATSFSMAKAQRYGTSSTVSKYAGVHQIEKAICPLCRAYPPVYFETNTNTLY